MDGKTLTFGPGLQDENHFKDNIHDLIGSFIRLSVSKTWPMLPDTNITMVPGERTWPAKYVNNAAFHRYWLSFCVYCLTFQNVFVVAENAATTRKRS